MCIPMFRWYIEVNSVNLLFWNCKKLHGDYGETIFYGYIVSIVMYIVVSTITPLEVIKKKKIVYIMNMHLFSWRNCLLLFHPWL